MYKKYKSCRGWIRTTITPSKEVGPAFRRPDNLFMVGKTGLEPMTFCVSDRRSKPTELHPNIVGRVRIELT